MNRKSDDFRRGVAEIELGTKLVSKCVAISGAAGQPEDIFFIL
jgi:hypothetical protein